jgi:membrane-bound serine protease (ClpP class)
MRDTLLRTPVRTIAFVNRSAFSAGALVAIASQDIYLAPGASMGAATPVDGAGETAGEKTISAVRSTFRATAEARGRDPRIAEAMVDPAVEIEGLTAQGQLLTLTATEAQRWGYADGLADSREDVLAAAGLSGATMRETAPGLAENVVRFLTRPVVASLLISLGLLLIWADVSSGGVGLGLALGLGLMGLFFWGHFLAGLAGWEGVALVVLGVVLLAAELFVIPGFGIAGLLGAGALLGGLFLSLVGGPVITGADVTRAAGTVAGTLVLLVAGGALALRFLPASYLASGLVLRSRVGLPEPAQHRGRRRWWQWWRHAGWAAPAVRTPSSMSRRALADPESFHGAAGVAWSDLRPAGIAVFDGKRVDVVTRGDYIPAGTPVEVLADEGYRRVVRRAGGAQDEEPAVGETVASNGTPAAVR